MCDEKFYEYDPSEFIFDQEQNEIEYKEKYEKAKEYNLFIGYEHLEGTEKQIKWAECIRYKSTKLAIELITIKRELGMFSSHAFWFWLVFESIQKETSAKKWIENREELLFCNEFITNVWGD